MYILYGWKLTGSLAIEAALRELEVDFEFRPIDTQAKQQNAESYRQINLRQQVPALVLPDGTVLTECAAILLHLADAFPKANLAPKPGTSERGTLNRWMLFFAVNIYEGELRKTYPQNFTSDPDGLTAVWTSADAYLKRHYLIVEQVLTQSPYFFGEQFTILDIYVWMLAQWMDIAWLKTHCPKIIALTTAVMNRPKIASVHKAHFGEGLGIKS